MAARRHLSPVVHRLVAPDRLHRPVIERLTPAQIAELKRVATAPESFDEPVRAELAVQALARGAKAVAVLGALVRDGKVKDTVRVTAARELGLLGTPATEKALRRAVGDENPRVQQAVFRALGTHAGPSTLRILTDAPEPQDASARRQLAFARTLIAHRHGLDTAHLRPVESGLRRPEQVGHQSEVNISLQRAAATAKDRKLLLGSTYGIELAARDAEVVCGRTWTVFLNRETDYTGMAERVHERPWILGLMAHWHRGRSFAIVKHVILTTPQNGRVLVDIVRSDGERIYTGSAESEGSAVIMTLTDVDRPATVPTFILVRISRRGIDVERAAVSSKRVGVRPSVALLPTD